MGGGIPYRGPLEMLCNSVKGGTKQATGREKGREGKKKGERKETGPVHARKKKKRKGTSYWAVLNLKTKTTSFGFKANFSHLIHFVNSIIK